MGGKGGLLSNPPRLHGVEQGQTQRSDQIAQAVMFEGEERWSRNCGSGIGLSNYKNIFEMEHWWAIGRRICMATSYPIELNRVRRQRCTLPRPWQTMNDLQWMNYNEAPAVWSRYHTRCSSGTARCCTGRHAPPMLKPPCQRFITPSPIGRNGQHIRWDGWGRKTTT